MNRLVLYTQFVHLLLDNIIIVSCVDEWIAEWIRERLLLVTLQGGPLQSC